MLTRGVRRMVAEAEAAVESVSAEEAIAELNGSDAVFVDVREPGEYAKGAIPGALPVPRGLLEFIADPESSMHKRELSAGRRLIVYCATGGRSALAAKTLKDMGIGRAANLAGGIAAWRKKGGPVA